MRTGSMVRYVGNTYYASLTNDKVYMVLKCVPTLLEYLYRIHIINDRGIYSGYFTYDNETDLLFEDVTIEIRNEVIDSILT